LRAAGNRRRDLRTTVRDKVRAIEAGHRVPPFSPKQLAVICPEEIERLRLVSSNRFLALSADEREVLRKHLFLVLCTLSDADYKAIATYAGRVMLPAEDGAVAS
jgi:hypothetical protein